MTAVTPLSAIADGAVYDLAVLGGGAAGLAAAVFAALDGKRVILIERTEYLGGTSAFSASTTWAPNTRHSVAIGADDSFEKARDFLDRAVGNRSPQAMREAFLRAAPDAIHTLEDHAETLFRARPFHPDYMSEIEGSTSFGRALEPLPFDGRALGGDLHLIRPPIREFTLMDGMMIDRDDIGHLLKAGRSLRSALYAARLFGRYLIDRIRYGRGARLVMGAALIGRLLRAARRLGVDIVTETQVTRIAAANGAVEGVVATQRGATREIAVRGGVVLASGGFARHPRRRAAMTPDPTPEFSPAAPGHTGELHDLAIDLGAHYGADAAQNCFWTPVSVRRREDGTDAVFPHFVFDRSKPGTLCVGRDGRRFVNESVSYHQFVGAMYAANRNGDVIPAFLIADRVALRKYGLGMVRPGGRIPKAYLDDGYVTRADTLAGLASALGVDGGALEQTVATMNTYAETGTDPEFGRGTTLYQRANGDSEHDGPNPTLGRCATPPFHAVRLWPGDIGSATGLTTDENARVLRADGAPIEGLYACGNDMQSIMGGVYPGPGITIGPALTFGYIAARHAGERAAA